MYQPLLATLWQSIGENWAVITIAATCLSLLLWVTLVMNKYVHICLNLFVDTPPPLAMGLQDFDRIAGEEVRFRSFDGVSLRGMWLWANEPVGTVVFCHEFDSDMYSCARYTSALMEAGFNIFTFDFRGHGESSKAGRYKPLQWPSDQDLGDLLGATAYAANRLTAETQPSRIGLFGISRGGAAAILAGASDENVAALLCDGAFSTDAVCISMMKRWACIFARIRLAYENHPEWFWKVLLWLLLRRAQRKMGCRYPSVRKALREMAPRPIMFVHGQKDSYVQVEQTQMLHTLAPAPKYMWIVPGAKHNQSVVVAPEDYARRTVAFFQKYLAGLEIDEALING
ncbi:MAG: alpha/beta fold hydrolase [Planctomycetes bacterium]|nr:alpha/beta fold hydrolase [Planctomycetota bacterium]